MSSTFSLKERHARIAVDALVALKIAALFILAWNRRFVMDEFAQFGWAKYIPDQIGRLATQYPKAEGYAVFFELAHLIGWSARAMLLLGRMEMALLACGTLAIIYASARALSESKAHSALIVVVLLSFSNFIERIFETRGDPLSVFFAAAALLVAIRGVDRRWWILAGGLLSGLAFLSTQKAVYFNFALGFALVGDAVLDRRFAQGIERAAWLVLGWLVPIAAYCLLLDGPHALAVAYNLFFGPLGVASPQTAAEYGGLRHFVVQTLVGNALLYLFCFGGMMLALVQIRRIGERERIALIFSVVVTALVFSHNQPWPYVFIMALPFMALWALWPLDALGGNRLYQQAAWAVLAIAIGVSFVKNVLYLKIDNHNQLALIARAEQLLAPTDVYFDGIGMLPNRREPSTLWLDRHAVLQTRDEGQASEAYQIFANSPPKLILWSYRMDAIEPLVGPLIRDSYARIAPNIRIAGAELHRDAAVQFNVPLTARYALYDLRGNPVRGQLELNGTTVQAPFDLRKAPARVVLRGGPSEALVLPQGSYSGRLDRGPDDMALFDRVYD